MPHSNADLDIKEYEILNYIPLGSLIIRDDFTILFWNRRLEEWTGMKQSVVINQKVTGLFPSIKQPRFFPRIQAIFEGGPPVVFSAQLHKYFMPIDDGKGGHHLQHTVATPVKTKNQDDIWVLITIEDVTDALKRLEENQFIRREVEEINKNLKDEIDIGRKSADILSEKNIELARTNQVMINRELKMIKLKEEIELLKIKLGSPS